MSKYVYIFRVRLGPLAFVGRVLGLAQARGPSAGIKFIGEEGGGGKNGMP